MGGEDGGGMVSAKTVGSDKWKWQQEGAIAWRSGVHQPWGVDVESKMEMICMVNVLPSCACRVHLSSQIPLITLSPSTPCLLEHDTLPQGKTRSHLFPWVLPSLDKYADTEDLQRC